MSTPSRPPAQSTVSTPGDPEASRLALVACWLAVVVRVLLVGGLIATPIAFASYAVWEWIYIVVLGPIVVLMAAYMGLAFTLRCPVCHRRFLVEAWGAKHPAARKAQYLGHWGTVVTDILRKHQFTCVYCGSLCRVS